MRKFYPIAQLQNKETCLFCVRVSNLHLMNHKRNTLLRSLTQTRESHAPLYLCGEWRISTYAANTAKNSNAYFGTFSQPNRKAGGRDDSYTRKGTHGTEVTSSTRACPKRALSNCRCHASVAAFSFWMVAHTQAKPGKLSVTQYICRSDQNHQWDLIK